MCPRLSRPSIRWGDLERDCADWEGVAEEEEEEEEEEWGRDDKEEGSWSSFDAQFLIRSLSRLEQKGGGGGGGGGGEGKVRGKGGGSGRGKRRRRRRQRREISKRRGITRVKRMEERNEVNGREQEQRQRE